MSDIGADNPPTLSLNLNVLYNPFRAFIPRNPNQRS